MARLIIATAALFPAVTTAAQAQSLLMRGDTGPEVRQWQQQLNLDEFPGADIRTDGIFGPVTENKTEAFQRWRGIYGPKTEAATTDLQQAADITVDGIVGPKTRSALEQQTGEV